MPFPHGCSSFTQPRLGEHRNLSGFITPEERATYARLPGAELRRQIPVTWKAIGSKLPTLSESQVVDAINQLRIPVYWLLQPKDGATSIFTVEEWRAYIVQADWEKLRTHLNPMLDPVARGNAYNAAVAAAAAERRKIREAEEAERRKRKAIAKHRAAIASHQAVIDEIERNGV